MGSGASSASSKNDLAPLLCVFDGKPIEATEIEIELKDQDKAKSELGNISEAINTFLTRAPDAGIENEEIERLREKLGNTDVSEDAGLETLVQEISRIRKLANEEREQLKAIIIGVRSNYGDIPLGPPDEILGLNEAFQKDTNPSKVSLGVGAYRDDDGKPYILPCVRQAEEQLLRNGMNHEYAGIAGIKEFVDLSLKFAYGENAQVLKQNRVAAVQSLSGTGACRVVGEFYATFFGRGTPIYIPNPTWGNHFQIMKNAGLEPVKYTYYNAKTCGLDFEGLIRDVEAAPDKSIFLLHACAHNPTGVDPSREQWAQLSELMLRKQHNVLFDCAYQGFASGDAEEDAWAIRKFVEDGHCIALAQSYAKNFGLYGERVGALSMVGKDKEEATRLLSQMKRVVRRMYSNPPLYGARLVQTILSDQTLYDQWKQECKGMAERIISMRILLRTKLEALGNPRPWNHITDQIGMFAFSGLSESEVERLRDEFSIFLTKDGRISMAGVNSGNVDYIANAINTVTMKIPSNGGA